MSLAFKIWDKILYLGQWVWWLLSLVLCYEIHYLFYIMECSQLGSWKKRHQCSNTTWVFVSYNCKRSLNVQFLVFTVLDFYCLCWQVKRLAEIRIGFAVEILGSYDRDFSQHLPLQSKCILYSWHMLVVFLMIIYLFYTPLWIHRH